ncbi:hypothetical protein HDU84_004543 [Entophlyctis sp. JEL0112]|nr:hypothetical protein HDU84_004543 [Entophlyctis sp. JEL0112]
MTTPPVDLCQKSKRQSSSNGLASDTTKFAKKIIPRLADYDIDPKTGFLPSSPAPLTRLSGTYFELNFIHSPILERLDHLHSLIATILSFSLFKQPWELVMDDIQRLLLAGRLRERVAALPMLDTSMLGDSLREWQRACVVISFIAQAFIWGKNERAEQNLPRCLAIPWLEICRKLEVLPIISYATVELWNFKVLNPSAKWDLSNLSILHTFSGGMDEAWFYLVSIAIEAEGARALPAIVDALRAVDAGDLASLKFALTVIADVTESITKILGKMYEKNDPHIFFHRVRPFMNGWGENSDDMPDGVLYEGVTKKENLPNGLETDKGVFGKYAGASAGQSSLIHSLDAFLQVEHKPMHGGDPAKAVNAMLEMRRYMPGPHRRFIQAITDSFSVRGEYVYFIN